MGDRKAKVLIVEDNDTMRKLLAAELTVDGRFEIEQAANGADGLAMAVSTHCDVIVLDVFLPDTDGLLFIEELQHLRSDDPPSVIAMTGASPQSVPDAVIEAPYRGLVSAVFRKPFDHAKLRDAIAQHSRL
ncbi:MAG: response regulator [Thermoanaerobaculia bacterium]